MPTKIAPHTLSVLSHFASDSSDVAVRISAALCDDQPDQEHADIAALWGMIAPPIRPEPIVIILDLFSCLIFIKLAGVKRLI
jgi:hypothetical protein